MHQESVGASELASIFLGPVHFHLVRTMGMDNGLPLTLVRNKASTD